MDTQLGKHTKKWRMLRLIYAFTSGGQLGNQLMYNANMISSSLEYDIEFKNFSFKGIADFQISKDFRKKILLKKHLCNIIIKYMYSCKRILKCEPGITVVLNNRVKAVEIFKQSKKKVMPILFHCWPYIDFEALYKHQDEVRKIIVPQKVYMEEALKWFDKWRADFPADIYIGVHIRQKDYKTYMEGKYYYNLETYVQRMSEAAATFKSKKVVFIVFSDENVQDIQLFEPNINGIIFSKNNAIVDLILMSKCTYLIGPPSTFSGWASFWGKTPKFIMFNSKYRIKSEDDFGVYMTEIMDDEVDSMGNKKLTKLNYGIVVSCNTVD